MAGDDGEAAAERVHVHEIRRDQGRADLRRPARLERNLAGDGQHPDSQGVQHFGQCGGACEAMAGRGERRDPFVREHTARVSLRGRSGWAAPRAFPALLVHVGSCRTRVTLIRSARSPCGYPLGLITFGLLQNAIAIILLVSNKSSAECYSWVRMSDFASFTLNASGLFSGGNRKPGNGEGSSHRNPVRPPMAPIHADGRDP